MERGAIIMQHTVSLVVAVAFSQLYTHVHTQPFSLQLQLRDISSQPNVYRNNYKLKETGDT